MKSKNTAIVSQQRDAFYHRKRFKIAQRRKLVVKRKKLGLDAIINHYKSELTPVYETGYINITVPSVLDLNENYAQTVDFVTDLRVVIRDSHKRILLYFDSVNSIGPAALLYLTAEIFRIRQQYPNRLTGTYPTNEDIANLLDGMGFYKLIEVTSNFQEDSVEASEEEVYIMKFTSDIGNIGKQTYTFLEKIKTHTKLSDLDISRIYGAIDEAMTNVTDHAFKLGVEHTEDNGPLIPMKQRWWLGGYVDGTTGNIFLMMHDQGSGIPSTLPITLAERLGVPAVSTVLKALGIESPSDSDYIKIAVSSEQSGTGLDYRGRGFKRMRKLIGQMGEGELRVLSLKGEHSYSLKNGIVSEQSIDHDETIAGTIVLWQLNCDQKGIVKNVAD